MRSETSEVLPEVLIGDQIGFGIDPPSGDRPTMRTPLSLGLVEKIPLTCYTACDGEQLPLRPTRRVDHNRQRENLHTRARGDFAGLTGRVRRSGTGSRCAQNQTNPRNRRFSSD